MAQVQENSQPTADEVDALIIGAGFSGLYQLYTLRQMGLSARVVEAGGGVGGTWYWNRYPGARCDSPSQVYQYWFSEELLNEWQWSERFPSQPEVLRYLNYVAEKFDLLPDIQFNTRVTAAHFNGESNRWQITTDDGTQFSARYFVCAVGVLTVGHKPDIEGLDSFQGRWTHTSEWPHEGLDLEGKKVGVVGTGATGIQVIQEAAKQAAQLTVFQRTANFAIPMNNPELGPEDWQQLQNDYPDIKRKAYESFAGFTCDFSEQSAQEPDAQERERVLEELWADGSLRFWIGNYGDIFFDAKSNELVAEFVRKKIRARIKDPELAEQLVPTEHPFGSRRVPLETGYFDVYNRDNVTLVDAKQNPIKRITPTGIETDAQAYDLDVIIFATGFNAVTGVMDKIDIRNAEGTTLRESWAQAPGAYLGLQPSGFPNLFMVSGPTAPSVAFCNYPTCAMEQVEWISRCIGHVHEQGLETVEATPQAQREWMAHAAEAADATLVPQTNSWWLGANIPGKPRVLLSYVGGAPAYREKCKEVAEHGYAGFSIS